ncbi:hypothetical protein AQI88_21530 [Streptomyces cellostaticus]|uniref:Uncharacterized protein n=1 Tax=Streptomyces cellostaticus TaxID=67285 RepID=A0A101NK49_9ACTN|nr:hypothetical protein [Streptomyces cellostaticus]KUM94527.1 hypothetical protein AQI88_21530 [Streptomyces cellostaticus]GHI07028.1 hypothetical protein Scel_53490 [Streptomyces cellostaticus]
MPEHVSTLQLIGVAALTAAGAVWAVVVMRLLRRARVEATERLAAASLPALPFQPQDGPPQESVELTPAEQDAFAGLVRQLGHR